MKDFSDFQVPDCDNADIKAGMEDTSFSQLCPFCEAAVGRELEAMWANHDHQEDFHFDCPYCDNDIKASAYVEFQVFKGEYSKIYSDVPREDLRA